MGVEMMNMEVENVFVSIGVSQVWVDERFQWIWWAACV
jgi:hypothetical protein